MVRMAPIEEPSIMMGIITFISVLERKKEIGILRSIGASRRDIANVFNAETFIEGLISGVMGIGIFSAITKSLYMNCLPFLGHEK